MGGNLGYKVPIQILKVDFGRFWVLLELVDVAFLTWNQPSLWFFPRATILQIHVPQVLIFSLFSRGFTYSQNSLPYTLWLFNSLPWTDPPFLRTVNHLFRLGPSKNHGELIVITRWYKDKTGHSYSPKNQETAVDFDGFLEHKELPARLRAPWRCRSLDGWN